MSENISPNIFGGFLKSNKTVLLAIVSGLLGIALGAGITTLANPAPKSAIEQSSPTQSPTPTTEEAPLAAGWPSGDPSKKDISASIAEAYPEEEPYDSELTLPAGSLDAVSDPAYPAAKNNLELTFFKVADASCKALKKNGIKIYHWDGSYELIWVDKNGWFKGNIFDKNGYFATNRNFDDFEPELCRPNTINDTLKSDFPKNLAVNFLIESMDGVHVTWHSHQGGKNLIGFEAQFADGLISRYFGTELMLDAQWIRYGLNKSEKASALKQY